MNTYSDRIAGLKAEHSDFDADIMALAEHIRNDMAALSLNPDNKDDVLSYVLSLNLSQRIVNIYKKPVNSPFEEVLASIANRRAASVANLPLDINQNVIDMVLPAAIAYY